MSIDEAKITEALTVASEGIIKRRIFNDAKDAAGNPIGPLPYSEQHERTRERRGRQTGKKDLNLTGALMLSITPEKTNKGHALIIGDKGNLRKAQGAEGKHGAEIFAMSGPETDEAMKGIKDVIADEIEKNIDELFDF